ncbi:hypothetical protein D9980_02030 [Serratia sp. 3ACOL1]|nr:hypothetical protein D9980_02030 [Serratia sp. 3ACOL1]
MEGDLTESAVVKDNTFDSMVRFGLKMAWFNLLALVIILMVASFVPDETEEWIDLVVSILCFINITMNILVFCFALVGLFKSRLKWSALLAMIIVLVSFALYLIVIIASFQTS